MLYKIKPNKMELNKNYLKGLVDGTIGYTTEFTQEIDLSDKECTYYVYVHQNGFAVRFDWIKAFIYDKFSNEDEPDYDHPIVTGKQIGRAHV